MDLIQLRHFTRLAQGLHFGRTALEARLSPSALSRSIQRLEAELGVTLFARDRRKVLLTDQGRAALQFAQQTLEAAEALNRQLALSRKRLSGRVSVFATATACQTFLPPLLSAFRGAHPEVRIELETGDASAALRRLAEGGVDVAVAPLPDVLPKALTARVAVRMPLVFATPAQPCVVRELCRRNPLPWSKLPLVLPASGVARQAIDAWFRRRRITPQVYGQVSGNEAILSLVSLGCGVGVVPRLVAEHSALAASLDRLEPEPRLPTIEVGMCTQRKLLDTPIVRALWDSLEPAAS